MNFPAFRAYSLGIFCLWLFVGCASMRTNKSHYVGIEEKLQLADYSGATLQIEAAKEQSYKQKDRVVYYLDLGMLYHFEGQYTKSNQMLEMAERAIEENFTRSISRMATSMILNDNALAYPGEPYEDVYLNVFKALNYLALNDREAAFVEIRRLNHKLSLLENKYYHMAQDLNTSSQVESQSFTTGKSCFQESALGRYLSMMLYRSDQKWDDARIDLEKIDKAWRVQPTIHPYEKPDFTPETTPSEEARLNLLVFVGLSPEKTADTYFLHTEPNLIILGASQENYLGKQTLSGLHAIPWKGIDAGYHFKIQLPKMKRHSSKVGYVEAIIDDQEPIMLKPIESIENAAIETFRIKKPIIYLRTLTRAILKGIAAQEAEKAMKKKLEEKAIEEGKPPPTDSDLALFRLAASAAVHASENADLRISRFFPAEAAVAEVHLPEGVHTVTLNYYDEKGLLLFSDPHPELNITAGRINLVQSAYLQ